MPTKTDVTLDEFVTRVVKKASLEHWTAFVRELQIPGDMMPALMTRRVELIKLIKPRPMNADEMKAMIDLIAGLLETNWMLQEHYLRLASLVSEWTRAFKGLNTIGRRIEHFANYRTAEEEEEDQ